MKFPEFATTIDRVKSEWAKLTAFTTDILNKPLAVALRLNRPAEFFMLWPLLWGFFSAEDISVSHIPFIILLGIMLRVSTFLYQDFMDEGSAPEGSAGTSLPTLPIMIILAFCSLWLAFSMGPLVLMFTVIWGLMVGSSAYLARITWWPQLVSAFIFGAWPVLIGQAAAETFNIQAIVLMLAAFCWVSAMETLKADSTRAQDLEAGLKSISLMMGERSFSFITISFIAGLTLLVATGMTAGANGLYYAGLMGAQALIMHKTHGLTLEDKTTIEKAYSTAGITGLIISLAFWIGVL